MVPLDSRSAAELQSALAQAEKDYQSLQSRTLQLDLTRGKPSPEQLALSASLDGCLDGDYTSDSGIDTRNYGGLQGLPEARTIFGRWLDATAQETLVGGNSSLSLMYFVLDYAMNHGLRGAGTAWRDAQPVKFLCPVPGYDRHFGICEHLGIEMIPVPMLDDGPDMDTVEALAAADSGIKGIWCVPRFSNPTGCVYSDATVQRMAALPALAGDDFLILWDNAYAVHALEADAPQLASVAAACRERGTLDGLLQFGSTSKVTLAGAGIAFLATSERNLDALSKHLGFSSIGPDKVNQLRHLRFFQQVGGVEQHMAQHAELLRPRFAAVTEVLERELGNAGMGAWTRPRGGYFISFDTLPGLAQETVRLADELGVKLTPAGATFPYGRDPEDRNIRLAPSFASVEEARDAAEAFAVCVRLASLRQRMAVA